MQLLRTTVLAIAFAAFALMPSGGRADSSDFAQPNPKLAKPLGHWPTADDIKRLESVKGRSVLEVLRILGHPKGVELLKDGVERWDYPWLAAASVYFRNRIATDTFYTAGF